MAITLTRTGTIRGGRLMSVSDVLNITDAEHSFVVKPRLVGELPQALRTR